MCSHMTQSINHVSRKQYTECSISMGSLSLGNLNMLYLGVFFGNLLMEFSMSVVCMLFKTLQDEFAQFY